MIENPRAPKRLRYKDRWFCYLDLLGFTNLVRSGQVERVIPLYEDVIAELERHVAPKSALGISHSWFSDTFIIFSRGDTDREFSWVEQAGRLFFQKLILQRIPVRGAITHGKLYSQLERNIFVGEALIDAYEYGEKQNWLGFILTPRACERLTSLALDPGARTHYRPVLTPGVITHPQPLPVYAFAFNNGLVNGENPYLKAIRGMAAASPAHVQVKYTNTENFILEHSADLFARAMV